MLLERRDARGRTQGEAPLSPPESGEGALPSTGGLAFTGRGKPRPYLPMRTSVDLTITVTSSPCFRSRREREVSVIAATTCPGSIATSISAMTAPDLTAVMLPFNWLRALSFNEMSSCDSGLSTAAGSRGRRLPVGHPGCRVTDQ